MRALWVVAAGVALGLSGCGMGTPTVVGTKPVTSVTPSASGAPNSVVVFGALEFVSVQGPGQIFTYNLSSGVQVPVGLPYATPCADPNGMVIATVGSKTVMAVGCYDSGEMLTLNVAANGTLSALGQVGGLPSPFPGIALVGTDVLIPLYGRSQGANGAVAKVSLANPAAPVVTAVTTLASPFAGGFANPGFLTAADGYIYVAGGSESGPQNLSSTIQVLNASTMQLVGKPLVVAHSPQHLVVAGKTLLATLYDAGQLESIDVTDPTNLQVREVLSLVSATRTCHPIPVVTVGVTAYLGCYAEGSLESFNFSDATALQAVGSLSGVPYPQGMAVDGSSLAVSSGTTGGSVYSVGVFGALSGR